MLGITSYGDPLVLFTAALVVISIPSGYLAWVTGRDRRTRNERDREQAEQLRLLKLIGTTFFGPDESKWPTPGKPLPAMTGLVQAVAHQVKPSNGKTVAKTVEEIKGIVEDQAGDVKDLREGVAKMAVLVAEHVSDGHGGKTSW